MKKIYASFLLLAVVTALQVEAAPPAHAVMGVEQALETEAGAVVLPSSPDGVLVLTPCQGCPPKSFRATASTSYLLNEQPTTLAKLRAAIAKRPKTSMTVSVTVKTGELVRVSANIVDSVRPAKTQ